MKYSPKQWVDDTMTNYGHDPETVIEMLHAMKGSLVPMAWIDEALKYAKRRCI